MQFTLEDIKGDTFFAMVPRDVRDLLILYYDPIALFEWQCGNGLLFCDGVNLLTNDIQELYVRKKHKIASLRFNNNNNALVQLVRKMLHLSERTQTQRKKELLMCFLFNNILLKVAREHLAVHARLLISIEKKVADFIELTAINPLFVYYRTKWRDFIAQCYVFCVL